MGQDTINDVTELLEDFSGDEVLPYVEVLGGDEIADDEITDDDDAAKAKASKHKIKGKHSLKYDSIFKGKKTETDDEFDDFSSDFHVPKQESFDFESGCSYHDEYRTPEDYARIKELREKIYHIITVHTDINIKSSRRKPAKQDFNKYLAVLAENLDTSRYSYSEIFIEFSFYFSDNIVNMFKLLDKDWGGKISVELAHKTNNDLKNIDFY